jgi:fumarylacetoacetate (FAA) hydrolase
VITGDVAQGAGREEALAAVRLLVLTNDYTYRHVLPKEYAKGVGFYQCKPARPFAPFAVTPATLGRAWRDGLLHATVTSTVNDTWLGSLDSGADCAFDFGAIIAHMARTRRVSAGSIVAAGTISSRDPSLGFACLAEKRAIEIAEHGDARTPLLQSGDRVRVDATIDGRSIFGVIDNSIVTRVRDVRTPRRRQHEQR